MSKFYILLRDITFLILSLRWDTSHHRLTPHLSFGQLGLLSKRCYYRSRKTSRNKKVLLERDQTTGELKYRALPSCNIFTFIFLNNNKSWFILLYQFHAHVHLAIHNIEVSPLNLVKVSNI